MILKLKIYLFSRVFVVVDYFRAWFFFFFFKTFALALVRDASKKKGGQGLRQNLGTA